MAWVKLDENFASHPKVVDAGPLGMALQVAALCYCNRHLTDGLISRSAARTLLDFEGIGFVDGQRGEDVTADAVIFDLLDADLWHEPGHDCPTCPQIERGYIIHDYLDQQPSRASVEEQKRLAAENGRKGGLAKAKRTAKREASEPLSDGSSESLAKVCPDTDTDTDKPPPTPPPPSNGLPEQVGGGDLIQQAINLARHRALEAKQAETRVQSPAKWLTWHERECEGDWRERAEGFLAAYDLSVTQLADCIRGQTNILRSLRRREAS